MASNNPFYTGTSSPSTAMPANGSTQRLALDNMIRRELKVSDPSDPNQIAQALLNRYKDDPRAITISQEARGLPFLFSAPATPTAQQASTTSDVELQQAKGDVERDLQELMTNSLLKDVTPEVQGWAQAVRSAIQEGTNAARFALDPRQRDKAIAIRRLLNDYARMARLVGALTPTLNLTYRKFAQSLDEVAAVIIVMIGEALANIGFNGGKFLLQTPYSELQVRRDAVIYALRNLVGATQEAYGPNDWPRGLNAYRSLFDLLESQGLGDLRILFSENELTRIMDELIQRAAQGYAEGLRALGSTAQLDLERFRRFVAVGGRVLEIESPPLTTFLEALQLFADAFKDSGGFRLLRIARPSILVYGLYGNSVQDNAVQRLQDLVVQRGVLAEKLDCFMQCGCSLDTVRCQVVLDKILYDVDRAIDLYALGNKDFAQPERRAAAYGYIITSFLNRVGNPLKCDIGSLGGQLLKIQQLMLGPVIELDPARPQDVAKYKDWIKELIDFGTAVVSDGMLNQVFRDGLDKAIRELRAIQQNTPTVLTSIWSFHLIKLALVHSLASEGNELAVNNSAVIQFGKIDLKKINEFGFKYETQELAKTLRQELCIQKDAEDRWVNLVKAMAPGCMGVDEVLGEIKTVIGESINMVGGSSCPSFKPSIPPHFETSLEGLVITPRNRNP